MSEGGFIPYQIIEVELSQPIPDLEAGKEYARQPALVLARLHTRILGVFEMEIGPEGVPAAVFARRIWENAGEAANAHLCEDGLAAAAELGAQGLAVVETPRCAQQRAEFLARAPSASVLVATHNRVDTLGPCLDSLLEMEYPDFEIIVIDNAPSDQHTAEFVRQKYGGRVRYAREDHAGLAAAHNRGLAVTSAPFIAITDDDVLADRYWLAEMMMGFTRAENTACVTGMIFPAEITTKAQDWIEHSVGYAKGYQPRPFNLDGHRPDNPLFPYAAGMFGSGANMAFKTDVIRALGGFDDSLGAGSIALGGDDLEAFFKVVAAGYTLVYQPAAIIYHRHHREYERLRKTAYGYGAGLTAYLTAALLEKPARVFDFARRLPLALRYALSAKSAKNVRKAPDYPAELTRIERKGMLAGPVLYLRSRWHSRNLKQKRMQITNLEARIPEIRRGNR